jgi:hypothetical protein
MAGPDIAPGNEHENLAGWVLGALDTADAERFRIHLQLCRECQDGAAQFAPTARLLDYVAPGAAPRAASPAAEPPADLRARTLERVRAAARKSSWRRRRAWYSSAAAAVAIVAGGSVAALTIGSSPAYAYELKSQNASIASGQATVTHTDGGWSVQMSATHLRTLPKGEYYECWWATKTTASHQDMISGGTFSVSSGGNAAVTMNLAGSPDAYSVMEVTVQDSADPGQVGQVVLSGTVQDPS